MKASCRQIDQKLLDRMVPCVPCFKDFFEFVATDSIDALFLNSAASISEGFCFFHILSHPGNKSISLFKFTKNSQLNK